MFDEYHCVAFNDSESVVSPYLKLFFNYFSSPDLPFLMLFFTKQYVDRWSMSSILDAWQRYYKN